MKTIIKNALILTAITLVAGFSLGLVYEITKDPIAMAKEREKQEACRKVFPEAEEFEMMEVTSDNVDEVYCAKESGKELGYVITATNKEGYGGPIQVSAGLSKSGEVKGIVILAISETAGLGMKASEPEFYGQYAGKTAERFELRKDGGSGEPIDAISGATITSRAVTEAVNSALQYFYEELGGAVDE